MPVTFVLGDPMLDMSTVMGFCCAINQAAPAPSPTAQHIKTCTFNKYLFAIFVSQLNRDVSIITGQSHASKSHTFQPLFVFVTVMVTVFCTVIWSASLLVLRAVTLLVTCWEITGALVFSKLTVTLVLGEPMLEMLAVILRCNSNTAPAPRPDHHRVTNYKQRNNWPQEKH